MASADQTKPSVRFGTDGWRGVIGDDFTFDNVGLVARAVARTFEVRKRPPPAVPIGFDHRFMADRFALEAAGTLSRYAYRPLVLKDPATSPLLSFITRKMKAPFGVMITASHNPAIYCGLKVKGRFGGSIPQSLAAKIEKNLAASEPPGPAERGSPVPAGRIGRLALEPYEDEYAKYLSSHLDFSLFRESRSAVVLDSLYGPGGRIAERALRRNRSKLRVAYLHNARDPLFGGLHPEPVEKYLADLKLAVRRERAVAGIALDGDGDRLGIVDDQGRYLTPQQVFSLLLYYLVKDKGLKGRVVQAVSLGYLSERIARDFGLPVTEVPVGFKYVAAELLKGGVVLGGEESGGYGFTRTARGSREGSILPERDGIFSGLLFLEMTLAGKKTAGALLKELEGRYGPSSFMRVDVPIERPIPDKSAFVSRLRSILPSNWLGKKVAEVKTLDGLKIVLDDGSWVLTRPSGTEPLLRAYAEFPKKADSVRSVAKIAGLAGAVMKETRV